MRHSAEYLWRTLASAAMSSTNPAVGSSPAAAKAVDQEVNALPRKSSPHFRTPAMPVAGVFAALLAFFAGLPVAHAQTWPTRPITMIVPFPAGGSTDGLARSVAQELSDKLGKPVLVDNRGG